jgi:hypothetical protein
MGKGSADRLNQLYSEMFVLLEEEKKICKETENILVKANTAICYI